MSDECEECRLWEAEHLETGEWDHFTVAQLRELVRVHHDGHQDLGVLVSSADLKRLMAAWDEIHVEPFVSTWTPPAKEFLFGTGLDTQLVELIEAEHDQQIPEPISHDHTPYTPEPAADGHAHVAAARRRCNPPDPGYVDEICACNTVVNPHVLCPNHKQVNDAGRVMCSVCDLVLVRSGVVGENIEARDATWMPTQHKDGTAILLGRMPGQQ